jgi:hypothetical protein
VIEYCEQHKDETSAVIGLSNIEMDEEENDEDSGLDYISEWDGEFLGRNVNGLFDLIEVRLRFFFLKIDV